MRAQESAHASESVEDLGLGDHHNRYGRAQGARRHDRHRPQLDGFADEACSVSGRSREGEEEGRELALTRIDLHALHLDTRGENVETLVVKDVAELHHVTSDEMLAPVPVRGLTMVPLEGMP